MSSLEEKIISATLDSKERVYLHVSPHEKLLIGKRGLVGPEQTNGIILSINASSAAELAFNENEIYVKLRFAGKWEDVFIPYEAVTAVFDDLKSPTIAINFIKHTLKPATKNINTNSEEKTDGKIIRPDFTKRR